MAAKKFKRVIPGQLEKLKGMFNNENKFFVTSFISSYYEYDSRFRKLDNYDFGGSYEKSIFIDVVFHSDTIVMQVMMKKNTNTAEYELFRVNFSLTNINNSHGEKTHIKNKQLRSVINDIIPSYHKIECDWIDHLDSKCIEYIERLFFETVNTHEKTADAVVWSNTFDKSKIKHNKFIEKDMFEIEKVLKNNFFDVGENSFFDSSCIDFYITLFEKYYILHTLKLKKNEFDNNKTVNEVLNS